MVFPVLVEPTENRIDDSIHALDIGEHDHGPGSPALFNKAALDGIGGSQRPPQLAREIKECLQPYRWVISLWDDIFFIGPFKVTFLRCYNTVRDGY